MGKKHKSRAPEPLGDLATATLILDRRTGQVTIEYEDVFTRAWEVRYMARRLGEAAAELDPDDEPEEDPVVDPDFPFRFGL